MTSLSSHKAGPAALDVVIMAAGKGTRMKSQLPKVLHRLGGRALLQHVLDTARALHARRVVVVTGHGAAQVEAAVHAFAPAMAAPALAFVRQEPQWGTGHAVAQAVPALPDDGVVLVLSGDVPLTQVPTLQQLIDACAGSQLALLTLELPDPTGYGRIVRNGQAVQAIVEHKDANDSQRSIREVYSGIMAVPASLLKPWLARLDNDNAQAEYYLTDVVKFAVADGVGVVAVKTDDPVQVAGVNSPVQLAELERAHQMRQAQALLAQGVRLADPARLDVRGTLDCGEDVEIDVNCVFEGQVQLGRGVRIGAHCVIAHAHIADGARILPFTHIDGGAQPVQVGEAASVGPFARLRPGAVLGKGVHIGNFVEVKNATLQDGAKANHLAYVGDATLGERVNYGAGSITANYDGVNKHRTEIGADTYIGSNCVLVAPVSIGEGGTVGAGSVVTKDTPPHVLTVARAKQISLNHWQRPVKAAPKP